MGKPSIQKNAEQGHSVLEFALVAIPTVLMLLGVVVVGINLGRSVQAGQVCRDADSMFVRGVDFSQTGARQMLAHLGAGLNLQRAVRCVDGEQRLTVGGHRQGAHLPALEFGERRRGRKRKRSDALDWPLTAPDSVCALL